MDVPTTCGEPLCELRGEGGHTAKVTLVAVGSSGVVARCGALLILAVMMAAHISAARYL